MDFGSVLKGLSNTVAGLEALVPVASMISPAAGAVFKAVVAVNDIVANIHTRVAEGNIAISSDDRAELAALTDRLAKCNDGLAEAIAES